MSCGTSAGTRAFHSGVAGWRRTDRRRVPERALKVVRWR